MPFAVVDALRLMHECPCRLMNTFFGPANQKVLQQTLADRVADATGVRIGEQDLLVVMVRAYRMSTLTGTGQRMRTCPPSTSCC